MFVDRYSTILTTNQWTARWVQSLKRKDGERNALNTCCADSVHAFKAEICPTHSRISSQTERYGSLID